MKTIVAVVFVALGSTLGLAQVTRSARDLVPTGKGYGIAADHAPTTTSSSTNNGIAYHGGPVMLGTPNVYLIWYGTWDGSGKNGTSPTSDSPASQNLLETFVSNLGGTTYEHINSTYYNGSGQHVTGLLNYAGSYSDAYSHGSAISDADVQAIVAAQNPTDTNGVYFVLTSSDVNETSGFCTQYCGWHSHATINGRDIKYAFVGNADRCPTACESQTTSPNNNSGADAMASIIAHEQEEAISDPDVNAWYDRRGNENADKCAWTYGTTSTASNGSKYNIVVGGLPFLIQRNWVNASGGYCAMAY
jgi:hypothetical protein